jgi:hypothetical protein
MVIVLELTAMIVTMLHIDSGCSDDGRNDDVFRYGDEAGDEAGNGNSSDGDCNGDGDSGGAGNDRDK